MPLPEAVALPFGFAGGADFAVGFGGVAWDFLDGGSRWREMPVLGVADFQNRQPKNRNLNMNNEEQTELVNRIAGRLWDELPPPDKFQPMNTGEWYKWLHATIAKTVATPNDPKLSDCGARRGSCVVRRSEDIRASAKGGSDETRPDKK